MSKDRSIVADRIERLLQIRDMSVADLCRESGVSESAISNILSGTRKQPRSDTVQKIARGFATSPDYLYGHTDNYEPRNAPPLPEYAAEVVEFMRQLDRGRNYELLLVARSFVEANSKIQQMTRQEIIELLLDISDQIAGEEDTNRVMKMLMYLEEKWQGENPDLPAHPPA
jgi:transcriptional regulator with XRE-family HTH domain